MSAAAVPAVAPRAVESLDLIDVQQRQRRVGCAWPEPDQRQRNEYCENGAKHINDEATTRRVTDDFFCRYRDDVPDNQRRRRRTHASRGVAPPIGGATLLTCPPDALAIS